jgi:hypothetical protein
MKFVPNSHTITKRQLLIFVSLCVLNEEKLIKTECKDYIYRRKGTPNG